VLPLLVAILRYERRIGQLQSRLDTTKAEVATLTTEKKKAAQQHDTTATALQRRITEQLDALAKSQSDLEAQHKVRVVVLCRAMFPPVPTHE